MDSNGDGNGRVYVRFGPLDTHEMPIEWAEKLLTDWRDKAPAAFGKALAKVVTDGAGRGR